MTVTIPVSMTQEEQAALLAKARAQGVTVDSLLRRAVLQIIAATPEVQHELGPEELEEAFEKIADLVAEGVPAIPDEALSRESIYTREDEW